jgi:LysR family transcriptional regulator for metE and metH
VDLVITSDPQIIKGIEYIPLFSYEMHIGIANNHALAEKTFLQPQDLADQTLITYPVDRNRLDVFNQFLIPAGVEPFAVRTSELTLMMVQLVASGRGVCALPNWVLAEYVDKQLISVRSAGVKGIWPTLYAAIREDQLTTAYVQDFITLARAHCLKNLQGVKQVHN